MGNCQLLRPTGQFLLEAGDWSEVELEGLSNQDPSLVVPKISGRLVK